MTKEDSFMELKSYKVKQIYHLWQLMTETFYRHIHSTALDNRQYLLPSNTYGVWWNNADDKAVAQGNYTCCKQVKEWRMNNPFEAAEDDARVAARDSPIDQSSAPAVAASLPAQGIKCSNPVYTTRGDKDTRKAWNGCRKKKCRNLFCTQPDCVIMSGHHQTICEKQLAQIQTRAISFYVTCISFSYSTLAISNACLIKSSYFGAKATSFLVKTFYLAAAHVIHDIAHFRKNPVDQQPA